MGALRLSGEFGPARRIFWLATTVLCVLAIVFAQSEAAVAAVLATLFLAAISTKRFRLAATAVAVVAAIVIAVISPLRHYALDKITFRDYSETVRLSQWTETVDMLGDHAILGAGLNGYPAAMVPYHRAVQFEIFQYPHTLFLNIWVELGLLGIVAFVLLAWRAVRSRAWLVLFPLLAMVVHSLFDVSFFKNDLSAMTWIFLAVAASAYAKDSRVRR